jgi:enolase-phosphatase E1
VTALPSALLLDVEGTTTPVDFVYRVLFPYAHARVGEFVSRNFAGSEMQCLVRGLGEEHAADRVAGRRPPDWAETPDAVADYARWLMDQDRKATALKSLQGRIWEEGFRSGALVGQVYEDVPTAFVRWHEAGQAIAIFSSGSVLAQKLLFAHSNAGDLTPHLREYFDTTTGAKREAESYRRIAAALGFDPASILFVSDVAAELDAARAAGLDTALCVREGPSPTDPPHRVIRTFDDLS